MDGENWRNKYFESLSLKFYVFKILLNVIVVKLVDDCIGCLFGMKEILNFIFLLLNKLFVIFFDFLCFCFFCMNLFFFCFRLDFLDCK